VSKGDNTSTINKILNVAEELFSEKGFNGTSVNMIAEKAGVNKALIYYYFKNKNDIINSLFKSIIKESDQYISRSSDANPQQNKEMSTKDAIKEEITFMLKRKKILSVMLMESLKGDNKDNYLFQCAENVFKNHLNGLAEMDVNKNEYSPEMQRYLVHEFFTGFIPFITFVVFQDKWCDYFKCDADKLMEYFLDSFNISHLTTKEQPDGGENTAP